MQFLYRDVPGHGTVVVSRHALARMDEEQVDETLFQRVLLDPPQPDRPDGIGVLWREGLGLRIVILTNPQPDRGARLVKTVYRVKPQARAR